MNALQKFLVIFKDNRIATLFRKKKQPDMIGAHYRQIRRDITACSIAWQLDTCERAVLRFQDKFSDHISMPFLTRCLHYRMEQKDREIIGQHILEEILFV